jgi:colanic acid/amylovoran biosynthesis protein
MKVLVVNAYVRENAGDAALLSVLLRQLGSAFVGADIRVSGMEDPAIARDFEGTINVGSVRQWTAQEHVWRPRRLARKLLAALVRSAWYRGRARFWFGATRILPKGLRGELEALQSADLVVSLGGGYLRGAVGLGGNLNVYFVLLPIVLAERLGTPVVLAPQSYGPFANHRQRRAAASALSGTTKIFVREDLSMHALAELGVPPELVERAVDSGFAFTGNGSTNWRSRLSVSETEILVGLTARSWLDPAAQVAYERAFTDLIDHVHDAYPDYRVVLIPQVISAYQQDDDRIVERRIADNCSAERRPVRIDDVDGHADLKDLYSTLDFLVGTRFHSVIFALTSRVPCIAVEYEHKTGGIMRDLGLEHWVLKMEKVTGARLISQFEELVQQQSTYRDHLGQVIPPYVARAESFQERIREVVAPAQSETGSHANRHRVA